MGAGSAIKQIQKVSRVLSPYRRFLFESIISGLLLSLLALPIPWLTKILVDNVLTTGEYGLLYFIVILLLTFIFFQGLMKFLRDFFMTNVAMRMTGDVQLSFLKHLQKLSFNFYDDRETGEILSRFADISGTLQNSVMVVNGVALNLVQVVFFPIVLFFVNWKLTLIAFTVIPFMVIVYYMLQNYIQKYTKRVAESNADLNARLVETLEGMKTIQSLGLEPTVYSTMQSRAFEVLNMNAKLGAFYHGHSFIQDSFKAIGVFLYTLFGWKYILRGEMTLGVYLAFTSYVGYFYGPMIELLGMVKQIKEAYTHTNRFFEIYDMRPDVFNQPKIPNPKKINGRIEFQDVGFGYNQREEVLSSINLHIEPHTVVALVGKSGSGKTTLGNLISRYYDAGRGTIRIDGNDVRDYELKYLRSNIGYVMQEPFLFNGSIKDNLVMGIDVAPRQLEQAISDAYISEFIDRLPDGVYTMVGQKGFKLSQGQKHRIAMARVLLRNTPIMILDEPTASLDIDSEEAIQKAMANVFRNRTAIIIAHRLSTIRNADMILVLNDGHIVERGDHDNLMAARKQYYQMYTKMMKA